MAPFVLSSLELVTLGPEPMALGVNPTLAGSIGDPDGRRVSLGTCTALRAEELGKVIIGTLARARGGIFPLLKRYAVTTAGRQGLLACFET